MDANKIETRYDDLTGAASVNFREKEDFNTFAQKVARVDINRYEPICLRVYIDKVTVVTIYALDRERFIAHQDQTGKLLVRKFKVDIATEELLSLFKQVDFTLMADGYKVEDFDVMN